MKAASLSQEEKQTFEEAIKKQDHEVELRFGTFKGKIFVPEITKDQFYRAFEFFKSNETFYAYEKKSQEIENYKNIRKITEDGCVPIFSQKKKISQMDNHEWGFRLATSLETTCKKMEFEADIVRKRTRHSFVNIQNRTRFDMDIFISENGYSYTIELECLPECSLQQLENDINLCLQILQNTKTPIDVPTKANVLKHYFNITKKHKFIGVQPQTISSDKYDKKQKYALTKKIDGVRYNMVCYNETVFCVSGKLEVSVTPYTCQEDSFKNSILDVEYYKNYYHVLDLVDQEEKGSKNLKSRLSIASNIISHIRPLYTGVPPIVMKEYFFTSSLAEVYSNFKNLTSNLNPEVYDGIILIQSEKNYLKCCPLKWKPAEMNTVDFLIVKNENLEFELYVGDKDKENGVSLFCKTKVSEKDYEKYCSGSIAEFSLVEDTWFPIKERKDKEKPNYKTVAEDNLQSIITPFIPEVVFKENVLFNMRRFHNYVKRHYINKFRGRTVLDLASGQGGDFGKYIDSGFTRIDAYDINSKSIKEASLRSSKIMKKYGQNVTINISKIDLNKKQVPDLGVKTDLVVTNFAFHYFYKNMEVYIKSVKNNLTNGGFLLMTFFDGELVKNIKNENYELIVENDQVEVRIKDSILDTPDKENIVDIKTVVNFLKSNGLVLVENVNFRDLYQDWKKLGRNSLTKEEKDLSFLNVALVFRMT